MNADARGDLIPVTLLTGYLGSGKTTVLNHLVRQPELADALVIINEFGEMSLDHMLVAHSTENLVMEMSNGCVCCNIRGDLVRTLRDVTWRFARGGERMFRRVLIETTGLADPAPIIHTLMTHKQIAPKYRLDGIVTVVDLATGMHTLDQHAEAIKQAAMADAILLTKADLITDEERTAVLARLQHINPSAIRLDVRHGEVDAHRVLNLGLFNAHSKRADVARWLKEEAYSEPAFRPAKPPAAGGMGGALFQPRGASRPPTHAPQDINRHDDHIHAFCFTIDAPITEETLSNWLDLLMSFLGSRILRVKGILNVVGKAQPVVVHGVQHVFHPPVSLPAWPSDDRRSRLVFITQDVRRETIEKTFNAFRPDDTPAQGAFE